MENIVDGLIESCVKDKQSVTADWNSVQQLISGIQVKEVKNTPTDGSINTEIFRRDWGIDNGTIDQIFQVTLLPGAISAWHYHQMTTDRIFVSQGLVKIVLYDVRPSSPTYNYLNEFRIGLIRPALVVVPPGIWHGLQNISSEPSCLLNLVDRAYCYEDPDHWRLPWDTQKIPYSFDKNQNGLVRHHEQKA